MSAERRDNRPKHSRRKQSAHALHARVASALRTIRPMLQIDGGDVELIDVNENGLVRVRLRGACIGCPSSQDTLTHGIERNLREHVPEITRVICS